MELTYRTAVKEDAELLIDICNSAFYDDYIHYGECPAYGRTKERMEQSIAKYTKYIIMHMGIPVGMISFENKGKGNYYIGGFCVIPAYQGMGIGTRTFKYIQSVCADWKYITLVTPADKEQNIRFYTEKCGFSTGETYMEGNVELVNLYMERLPHASA